MKNSIPFLIISFIVSGFLQGADEPAQLEESLVKWAAAKEKSGGNYSYQITTSSMTGFRTVTTITVEDGKVVERKYEEMAGGPIAPEAPGAPAAKEDGNGFTEKGEEIGKNKKGAPAHTVDELYAKAKKVLEKPRAAEEKLYVKFDEAGLLKNCFTVDTRIMDDAPINGVIIANLKVK